MKLNQIRALADTVSAIVSRAKLAARGGKTFNGKRDMYDALGYLEVIQPVDYRARYRRNAVAARVIESFPISTWRGGCDVYEDESPEAETEFEKAIKTLDDRLDLWGTLKRADILAGLGHYSVILIGAEGALETPLETVSGPDGIVTLSVFAEEDATVERWNVDNASPRFGLPEFYSVKRTTMSSATSINAATLAKRVHWTRIIHVADGLLDDRVFGTPRLERVWNLLDDLEKVTGGGAESFWKRADQGMQLDIDPTVNFTAQDQQMLEEELEEYTHGLRRILRTRGLKINPLGSDVADMKGPVGAIIEQISAGTGIPQRVLMGSEQGRLAADQDSVKYYREVEARRGDFGEELVRDLIDRFIALGAVPQPTEYFVDWSQIRTMDDGERADLAKKWVDLNSGDEQVVTANEIREQCLGLDAIDQPAHQEPLTAKGKERPWKNVHRAADRFPKAVQESSEGRVQAGKGRY